LTYWTRRFTLLKPPLEAKTSTRSSSTRPPFSLCGSLETEVGFSARNDKEWDQLIGALQLLELVETSAAHVARARQTQRLLSARRKRGRKVPDLLIAAAAEEHGLTLLHYETDFDLIAEVTGQSCQWIVTKGSID
jgi:predicted nucleic acid-binding protein